MTAKKKTIQVDALPGDRVRIVSPSTGIERRGTVERVTLGLEDRIRYMIKPDQGGMMLVKMVELISPVDDLKPGDVVRFDIPKSQQVGPHTFVIATALGGMTMNMPQAFRKAHLVDVEIRRDTW